MNNNNISDTKITTSPIHNNNNIPNTQITTTFPIHKYIERQENNVTAIFTTLGGVFVP